MRCPRPRISSAGSRRPCRCARPCASGCSPSSPEPSADMRASLEQHLGSRQVGRVVYGTIIGLALVVALESHPPEPGVMAVWLLGTGLAVGLAEVYSEVVGAET